MRWESLLPHTFALVIASIAICSAVETCGIEKMAIFDRTIMVTGCNGRIGTEIVRQLFDIYSGSASERTRLVCVARSEDKVKATIQKVADGREGAVLLFAMFRFNKMSWTLRRYAAISRVLLVPFSLRLSDSSVQRWGQGEDTAVDVLVNNAAVTPTSRQETKEGIELQFATNVLGYHWMMREFEPFLSQSAQSKGRKARVVNVASFYAGGLDVDDCEFKKRPYDVDSSYRASKEANRLQSSAMAMAWKKKGINVNSVHPGVVTSNISLGLGFDLNRSDSAARGCAEGPVKLASDESLKNATGQYFTSTQKSTCQYAKNVEKTKALMELLESYTISPV